MERPPTDLEPALDALVGRSVLLRDEGDRVRFPCCGAWLTSALLTSALLTSALLTSALLTSAPLTEAVRHDGGALRPALERHAAEIDDLIDVLFAAGGAPSRTS